jgi:hypothetical protein
MKFRMLEEVERGRNVLCPYVVCEGCDQVVRAGEVAIVIRDFEQMKGDVEVKAFHQKCDSGGGWWRPLGEWLSQTMVNSVKGEAF